MGAFIDLTGQRFGRLTVMSRGPNKGTQTRWQCVCSCGEELFVAAGHLKNSHTKSCGCLQKEKATIQIVKVGHQQTGEANPMYDVHRYGADNPMYDVHRYGPDSANWKGGVTSENCLIRSSTKYAEWRGQVFERDRYTCQKCSTRARYLNAHHMEGFDNNPELRTKVSNGITLCEGCHVDFHHQYGRGNNTKAQLDKFMRGEQDA